MNPDFSVRKFFQLNISEGVRIGEEVVIATDLIFFTLFIEISIFYHTEGQFYAEDSSEGYLMLGTQEPGVNIFSRKFLSDLAIVLLSYMVLVTPIRPE